MNRRQFREITLIVELEWDPDVEDAWPEIGPDHSAVIQHAVELMTNAIETEPPVPADDPGQFRVVAASEAMTPWPEWGVTVSCDETTGRRRRNLQTIYGAPVQRYKDDPDGGWPVPM
jgi:hypothetical protein